MDNSNLSRKISCTPRVTQVAWLTRREKRAYYCS